MDKWANLSCEDCADRVSKATYGKGNGEVQSTVGSFLETVKRVYNNSYNEANAALDKLVADLGDKKVQASQNRYLNESLQDIVTNRTEVQKIIITDDELLQKDDPLYIDPVGTRFLDAPFYSHKKYFFGTPINTFWANILVLWSMTLFLIVALYFDWLRKLLEIGERIKLPGQGSKNKA
jgi:hypothetical protein